MNQVQAEESTAQRVAAEETQTAVTAGKVAQSAVWRVIETAGTEMIAFIVVIALGRMLGPEAFGAVSLASSIMAVLQGLLYHGFTEALIQKPDVDPTHHASVLAANVALAAVLVGIGVLLAWPLGWMLGRAEFPLIFCALLPSLFLRGLISPMLAALRRDMDFRSIALRTLLGVFVGGIVAVTLVQHGAGLWALVVQQWSVELVGFLVLVRTSPIKPWSMRWNTPILRELTPVAIPVMTSAFISIGARKLDILALGLFLPNGALGIYFMVNRVVFAAQMVTQHGLNEVAMVVLSSISQDPERYRRGLLRAMRLMSYVCACAFGLLAVAGPWLLPLVFGAKWLPAAEPLRVLAMLSVGGAVVSIVGVTFVASGKAAEFSRLSIGSAFLQLAAVAIAARWGLMAVAWAVGIAQCLPILPALRMLKAHYQVSWSSMLAELVPILGMFVIGFVVAEWIAGSSSAWYTQPLASLVFCAVMGMGALVLLRKERSERATLTPPAPN